MLTITGRLTKTKVEYTEPTLPAAIPMPSRREAIEGLEIVQKLVQNREESVLADNEVVTISDAFETLRRFVLTR